ncbi:ABC transporter permease [Cohnella lubricantis]|uniref:ABC transporter permease n=1 Tax=Cohnella lubricantis TaxID=2163172 RepID=A0A841TB67_9BACL|nr:ABC transporter permease [Cohnella lubricantis]MBB6677336.1 ABC transporter permease [Cohnella lubricantis]MBP2116852.1 oligopeptide transport system permease protein [Cohnella lubricantis]
MVRYWGGKLVSVIISLFVLATATFFLMKAIPGDPFTSEKAVPPEVKAKLMAFYGLDKPIWEQYLIYLKKLIHLDLGTSMKSQYQTVSSIITDSFGYSLRLGIFAIIVSVIVGVGLGVVAAMYHRKAIDGIAMVIAVLGVSIPNFVLASMTQYLFGYKLQWFQVAGLNGPFDYVLPVLALAALPIAYIARLTRSTMLEVLNAEYIKTAKAKGLKRSVTIVRHALRNGILPVVTYVGPMTANILTGSVVVERIFGIPGLGKYFVDSVSNRDYTLIMGITLFYAVILMLARLLTDLLYGLVDPRIGLRSRKGASS